MRQKRVYNPHHADCCIYLIAIQFAMFIYSASFELPTTLYICIYIYLLTVGTRDWAHVRPFPCLFISSNWLPATHSPQMNISPATIHKYLYTYIMFFSSTCFIFDIEIIHNRLQKRNVARRATSSNRKTKAKNSSIIILITVLSGYWSGECEVL